MPNGPPGRSVSSSGLAMSELTAIEQVSQTSEGEHFAHAERKYWPVRRGTAIHGRMGPVSTARSVKHGVSLVVRRHVDFKRVCSCTCRP
ncbi:Ms4527A family Cys-rich leader peptide [Mycolicibacterium komossense]|uniref:Ms4527A family Cys-rich leader peptide n=1 Tax=Mycolicibacterium komossense TaxID=1779 RepID=UPI00338F44E0